MGLDIWTSNFWLIDYCSKMGYLQLLDRHEALIPAKANLAQSYIIVVNHKGVSFLFDGGSISIYPLWECNTVFCIPRYLLFKGVSNFIDDTVPWGMWDMI